VDGILVINKPEGLTSHQVVSRIRRLFPGVKAGHSGTLDPMARGVLPVCLGRATRLVEYIIEQPKEYRAEVTLGTETDTEDATGTVTVRKKVPSIDHQYLEMILDSFQGEIEQLPPLYSAVKHRGKPLYHWTRKGEYAPRRIRRVHIYKIELLHVGFDENPVFSFDVKCSKGTYIRTLAADIGKKIGCGAHLSALTRLRVGPYTLKDSLELDELECKAAGVDGSDFLKDPDTALVHLPSLILADKDVDALGYGQLVTVEKNESQCIDNSLPHRIYRSNGVFAALASVVQTERGCKLKTIKYLER